MFVYIAICLSLLFPLYLQRRSERLGLPLEKTPLAICCLILFFLFAMRGEMVGVDTKHYCRVYRQFIDIPLQSVFSAPIYGSSASTWTFEFEPGYRLFNKLLTYLSGNSQTITIAIAILIYIPLYLFIYRGSPNAWLSIWLFVTLGIFQTDMNVSRNAVSIFLCYLALPLIRERRLVSYIVVVLLASAIHQSALLFLPVYFLIRFFPLNGRRMMLIFAVALLIGVNFTVFGRAIQSYVPAKYVKYLVSTNTKLVAIAVGAFDVLVLLLSLLMLKREERFGLTLQDPVGSWIFLLHISFFALSLGFSAGARAAALFGPYLIVLIPQILERIGNSGRKRTATALIAALCFAQYAVRMAINNIGGSIPYQFFWQG